MRTLTEWQRTKVRCACGGWKRQGSQRCFACRRKEIERGYAAAQAKKVKQAQGEERRT